MNKDIVNLLEETEACLIAHGKTFKDVEWIGCEDFFIPIEDFKVLANNTYDSGYGAQKVATDLVVVGGNFWLKRREYDGSEWWEYEILPKKPKDSRKVFRVIGDYWNTLTEMNEGEL